MLVTQFNALLKQRLAKAEAVLGSKAAEYATDDDRLHNFKVAARYDDESPEKALWGMLKKHLVSLQDMINATEKHAAHHPLEMIDEKVGDSINYLILLEAIMKERLREQGVDIPAPIVRAASRMSAQPSEAPVRRRKTRKKAAKKKATRRKGPTKKRS